MRADLARCPAPTTGCGVSSGGGISGARRETRLGGEAAWLQYRSVRDWVHQGS